MTTQSTRFPSYGTGTTRDASSSSQPLNSFSPANWNQSNSSSFWSNHISPTFSNTEPQTTNRAGHDDSFASNTDSANNYPQMADPAAVWSHPSWNNVDATSSRRPSASSSTAHMRTSAAAFPSATATTSTSYLTARANFSTSRTLDANTNAFRYPPAPLSTLRDSIGDPDDGASNAPAYPSFSFDAKAPSTVFPTTAAPSGASISTSTATSTAGHAHRASLQGPVSFPSPTPSGQIPYSRQSQSEDSISMALADLVRRQTLNEESPDLNSNIYPASPSVPFQFNPGLQPWTMDPVTTAALLATRANLAPLDRGVASAGAAYRQMTNSRGLGMNDQWGQPASRDLRTAAFHGNAMNGLNGLNGLNSLNGLNGLTGLNGLNGLNSLNGLNGLNGLNSPADLLHRAQSLHLLQEQQQLAAASAAATAASYTGAPNPFPGNVPPYYGAYRAPMQSPHLGLHAMNPSFVQAPHVQIPAERDPTHALRSAFLDEFRANRMSRKYELKDIYGHMVEFSGDQHGSRFIQDKLETASSEEKEHAFLEISKNTLVLMRDVFGNYVVQKLFDYGSQVQKKYLAEQMKGSMVALATQTYACRVIQKALSHILVEQQVELAQELEPDIIGVVQDPNGNHVVQKIIELVPREHIGFIIEAFRGRVKELSSHNFGCRVIQRILEHGLEEDKALILAELHENIVELVNDQFGNYVVQHVIQHGKQADRERIIGRVLDRMVALSNNKFASNVVERCIQYGTAADRRRIREELNQVAVDGQPILQHMIKDQYGNYVIQKLLKQLKGEEFRLFFQAVSEQLVAVRPSTTGRQSGAMERLTLTLEQTAKANGVVSSIGQAKGSSSTSPASPQLLADQDSTPSLTSMPTTPESSNPPSVKAGLPGRPLETDEKETATATHQPKQARVSVASL